MNLAATFSLYGYGTSEGVRKAWETRRSGGAAPSQAFVSPNVKEGTTLDDALAGLKSPGHQKLLEAAKGLVEKVTHGGSVASAIGSWTDGAENAVVFGTKGDYEQTKYMVAKLGLAANQKGVIAFHADANGQDTMWRIEVSKNYTLKEVGSILDRNGITDRSLIPRADGVEVRVFDKGSAMRDKVRGAAKEYGEHYYKSKGQGGYIGGSTREEGAAEFRKIIEGYGGLRASGDRRDWNDGRDFNWDSGRSAATEEITAYGTSEGVRKEWDARGRKEQFALARKFFADRPDSKIQDLMEYPSMDKAVGEIRSALKKAGYAIEYIGGDEDFDPPVPKNVRMVEITSTKGKAAINAYVRTDGQRTFALFDEQPMTSTGGLHLRTPFSHVPEAIEGFLRTYKQVKEAGREVEAAMDIEANRKLHYRTDFQGLPISIENRKDSIRRGEDDGGHGWATKMHVPYGYIRGTTSTDGDGLDVFLGPNRNSRMVYVIHINRPPDFKSYDEDKIFLGFQGAASAKACFMRHYDNPKFYGGMDAFTISEFKKRIRKKTGKPEKLVGAKLEADAGEPNVYPGGYAHIEPRMKFRPPSLKNVKPVPVDDPMETDDRFGDVTRRRSAETIGFRDRLTKRKGSDEKYIGIRTTQVSGFPSVTVGGFSA